MFPEQLSDAVNWHVMLALTRAMPDVHLVMANQYIDWAERYFKANAYWPTTRPMRHAMWRDCLGKGRHRLFVAVYDPDDIMPVSMRQGRVLAAMYAEQLPVEDSL